VIKIKQKQRDGKTVNVWHGNCLTDVNHDAPRLRKEAGRMDGRGNGLSREAKTP